MQPPLNLHSKAHHTCTPLRYLHTLHADENTDRTLTGRTRTARTARTECIDGQVSRNPKLLRLALGTKSGTLNVYTHAFHVPHPRNLSGKSTPPSLL